MWWTNGFYDVKDSEFDFFKGEKVTEVQQARIQNCGYHKKLLSSNIVVTTKIVVKQNCGYHKNCCQAKLW